MQKQVYGQANQLSELLKCEADSSGTLSTYKEVWQTLDTAQGLYGSSVSETTYGFTTNTYSAAAAEVNSAEYQRNRDLLFGVSDKNTWALRLSDCETDVRQLRRGSS